MKRDYFEGADVAVTICAKDGTIPAPNTLIFTMELIKIEQ